MAALPYWQLYIADYDADTAHLTTEEHGAYLTLMKCYWSTGKPLRADRIKTLLKIPPERIEAVKACIAEFFIEKDGFWYHPRLEADLEAVKDLIGKRSEAGKASARARAAIRQQQIKSGLLK